ncbi:ComEC/Rec2 family competence protein [Marinobacter nauticus]|uniref:ComEC/Rec2 family competence protein n=1 Tax=Marinobacter nauticus TaxID=2743 RepID=UPI0040450761
MARFHFLNVKNGDCSIIQHSSGHVSVIDVCNARLPKNAKPLSLEETISFEADSFQIAQSSGARKNYGQKKNPVNPIEYLISHNINSIFRMAVTHPDMDHMDGLKDLFQYSVPANYYFTKNEKVMNGGWEGSPYREEDWLLYKELRDSGSDENPKTMNLYSGDDGIHRTRNWDNQKPGDAFFTLAPSHELVESAIQSGDYNDSSYVFMYWSPAGKIIVCGDSHDNTWDHILKEHEQLVSDVSILVAPHHGRKSSRSYEFLDVLKPKMTFFGNAPAKDLAYSAWKNRGLDYITNNMAGSMVVNCEPDAMDLYVTHEDYARDQNPYTFYCEVQRAWFVKRIV